MSSLKVEGGAPLKGIIPIGGNKNAALPMIAGCLLTGEEMILHNVPDIRDVHSMLQIAASLGAEFEFQDHTLHICARNLHSSSIDRELCSQNRTSILFAAPLIARFGKAELFPPGGDVIGRRRLDGHFYGLTTLGADLTYGKSYCFNAPKGLHGRELFLDEASVTATEQILLAAATAEGRTVLFNAA
ncbi:MAG: UDP-N-acetylglucosamine 1-carboxyvinyltransferase, partial [Lentisphaeria bacterium]|nr:UDP-N-acetylglucosamine 1-carboxyvinyltransferase [Lentisphaeria bacterium]